MPTEEVTAINLDDLPQGPAFQEMIEAGVFYGRKKTKTNPKMKPYIFGNRGGIEIIDLSKTLEGIEKAAAFLKEKLKEGGLVLFVGTQPAALGIEKVARDLDFPVVVRRWIGGTLTNFETIHKRIEYFKKLKADLASGALQKYTKKERLTKEREIKRLEELIGGLESLHRKPDVLLVVDPHLHTTAVREARRLTIPVVAFANTDADPDVIDYLVIGNNAARKSIEWFLGKVSEAVKEGKTQILEKPAIALGAASPKTEGPNESEGASE